MDAPVPLAFQSAPDFSPLATPSADRAALLAEKADRLKSFEDQIFEKSMRILSHSMDFADIEEDQDFVPQEWIDEAGGDMKLARARFRVAKGSWKGTADQPAGIKTAVQTAMGIIRARSTEKQGPRVLNVQVVNLSGPLPVFDAIDVEPQE
jgi:hypothetical protein